MSGSTYEREQLRGRLTDISREIVNMVVKKNEDYGDSNLVEDGLLGISIRMKDKCNRLKNLSMSDAEVDETVEDTLLDLAGYSINALRLLREHRLPPKGL